MNVKLGWILGVVVVLSACGSDVQKKNGKNHEVPTTNNGTATNNDTTATNNDTTATNNDTTATNNDTAATNNDTTATNNDTTATNNDTTTANNQTCSVGLELCEGACIDTAMHPLHCGGCGAACETGEVCVDSTCELIDDCVTDGCAGFTYCDATSVTCLPGCDTNSQCAGGQICNTAHACECPADTHMCGGICLPDDDVGSCGNRCDACPSTPNGTASCSDQLMCETTCADGYLECGATCAACPSGAGISAVACEASQCVISACAAGFHECSTGCCAWQSELIDDGFFASVDATLDSTGAIHVSYQDISTVGLTYARGFNGAWSTTKITTMPLVAADTAITVDEDDYPHIVYPNNTDGHLKYTVYNGAFWFSETAIANTFADPAIEIVGGEPIVVMHDAVNDRLLKSTRNLGTWTVNTLTANNAGGAYPSLALGPMDEPLIAYRTKSTHELKYMKSSTLTVQLVDATSNVGPEISLAIGSDGHPRIAYADFTNINSPALMFAEHDGIAWQVTVVDSSSAGDHLELALDSQNRPHIAYYDGDKQALAYAHRQGSSWTLETVEDTGNSGQYAQLLLDSADRPHFIHLDDVARELRHVW